MDTTGFDVAKIKANVVEYWQAEGWNWPVKVMSSARGTALGLSAGRVVAISGYVTSEKFVRGRPLNDVEQILGLIPGELAQGAILLRLNTLPTADQFELRGYTQTPAGQRYYGGAYPPGLGANQWELTVRIPATVLKVAPTGQRL